MTSLEEIAVHEAGHAVVAELFGFKPMLAIVRPAVRGGYEGSHFHLIPPIPIAERRWGVLYIAVAGHLAESLCGFAKVRPFHEYFRRFEQCCTRQGAFVSQSDHLLARQQAQALSGAPKLFTDDAFIEFLNIAEREVRPRLVSPAPWAALRGVADRLMQVGQVDEHGFGPIFERANFDTRTVQPN